MICQESQDDKAIWNYSLNHAVGKAAGYVRENKIHGIDKDRKEFLRNQLVRGSFVKENGKISNIVRSL